MREQVRYLSVGHLGVLGYVRKLEDAGVVATRDHLVRYAAQLLGLGDGPQDVMPIVNTLVKRGYLHRDDMRYVRLTPPGREVYVKALEILGVQNG